MILKQEIFDTVAFQFQSFPVLSTLTFHKKTQENDVKLQYVTWQVILMQENLQAPITIQTCKSLIQA